MEPIPAFLFDRMLGSLCRWMRLLGFDAEIIAEGETGRLLLRAAREGRIAVTRARRRDDRPGPHPVILSAERAEDQIVELLQALDPHPSPVPFSRCLECNEPVEEATGEEALAGVPPYVRAHFSRFNRCPACGRVYWEGTHYHSMSRRIDAILERLG